MKPLRNVKESGLLRYEEFSISPEVYCYIDIYTKVFGNCLWDSDTVFVVVKFSS